MSQASSTLAGRAVEAGIADPALLASSAPRETPPWPVAILLFIGAQLSAVPFVGFLGMLLGSFFERGMAPWIFGPVFLAGAVIALRRDLRVLFLEHLAFVALQIGFCLLAFAAMRDLDDREGLALAGAVAGLCALLVRPRWVVFVSGVTALLCISFALPYREEWAGTVGGVSLAALILAAAPAAIWWRIEAARWSPCNASLLARLDALSTGLGTGVCAYLVVITLRPDRPSTEGWTPTWLSPDPGTALAGGVAAIGAAFWLAWRRPGIRGTVFWMLCAAVAFLSLHVPGLGVAAAVGALAFGTLRHRLALLAAVTGVWLLGRFYHDLELPLLQKSIVMAATGAVVAGVCLAERVFLRRNLPAAAERSGARTAAWRRWLVLAGGAVVLLVANAGIRGHERTIDSGQPVFVELAPVDPRSLMQGDYMALRFRMEVVVPDDLRGRPWSERPRVVLRIGDDRVGTVLRLDDGAPLGERELRMELTPTQRGWALVTDAFYFAEGRASHFESARYGEFRVTAGGRALLVGLADQDLRPLR